MDPIMFNREEGIRKYNSYMVQFGIMYTELEREQILLDFNYYLTTGKTPELATTRQMLKRMDLLSEKCNPYQIVADIVKRKYGFDRNIVEVAAGRRPIFSEIVDKEQQIINKGTITAIDKNLEVLKNGNIILLKEEFTFRTDITKFDLGVAIEPCSLTDIFTRRFNELEIPIILYCCNCPPEFAFQDTMYVEEWLDNTEYYARTTLKPGGRIFTERTPDNHLIIGTEYPDRPKCRILN